MDTNKIDILNRDKFVDDVFSVIETLSDNRKSCTFAINGEWGSGKSFVLDMLEERLSIQQSEETASDKYAVFHYNCWQYDYYEEPLYAIVSSMYDWIKSNESEFAKKAKNILLYVLIAFGLTTKDSVNNVIKLLTDIDFSQINKDTKETIEKINTKGKLDDELYTVQESIEFTRNLISKITEDQTVIIVVDELDRCLPEYAIKVLERLHHLFDDIENLVVILAVDKRHLDNTVKKIFNLEDIDINQYLAKFIDFEINLDIGVVNQNYKEKYSEYYSRFYLCVDETFDTDVYISCLLEPFDARKRDKIIKKALLIHDIVFDEPADMALMCVELLFVAYSYMNIDSRNINSSTYLFDITSKKMAKLSEFFNSEIIGNTRISFQRDLFSESIVANLLSCETINMKNQILYYISRHPKYLRENYLNGKNAEYFNKNAKKIEKFFELLNIIE